MKKPFNETMNLLCRSGVDKQWYTVEVAGVTPLMFRSDIIIDITSGCILKCRATGMVNVHYSHMFSDQEMSAILLQAQPKG